jgi:hypothetical protein
VTRGLIPELKHNTMLVGSTAIGEKSFAAARIRTGDNNSTSLH